MTNKKTTETFDSVLSHIQRKLKAPKNQLNKFGGYSYRSCEDIVEAVKPLLSPGAFINISDEIVVVGDRYYVKATATFRYEGKSVSSVAFAREPLTKKGMDESQLTGSTSSYARKYALNGLLAIDDGKDADTADNRQTTETAKTTKKDDGKPWFNEPELIKFKAALEAGNNVTLKDAKEKYKVSKKMAKSIQDAIDDYQDTNIEIDNEAIADIIV